MKNIEDFGIKVPEILLPKKVDLSTWSVIACDQYTQDLDYWKRAEKAAETNPSTLNLILPEVYLGSPDKQQRIEKIRKTMKEYLENGVFAEELNGFIYLERTTAFGRTRKGLMAQIDLETYEWKPFSKANIRATEATIVERIPPRMEIRRGAPLELPHIMLLVNDKEDILVGGSGKIAKDGGNFVYEGKLMNNGGNISGWSLSTPQQINAVTEAVEKIAEQNKDKDGSTFLFAVGDGNHSLATAKAVWDEYKEANKDAASDKDCPVRYALVEIVNIYDSGLTFEPIHRVIFNAYSKEIVDELAEKLNGKVSVMNSEEELINAVRNSWANFGFDYVCSDGSIKYLLMETQIKELAVSRLQPVLDEILKSEKKYEIDYIHGTEEVLALGKKPGTLGILLPPIAKDSFFETINGRGPLPRKSFSMGEADEKRFYLECRRLFPNV